ncbi:MAG: thiamine biosynthesis protein ThiF [Campylobacterota bacterium]|nr:thiamine biosynthesis protein ThiF [Campylobacterota bacterium]
MTHGSKYDLNSPLVCEGVIGDGCGGGRLFLVEDETLIAYDPQTQESVTLFENIVDAREVSKEACIVTIRCKNIKRNFDLSSMKEV